MDTGRAIEPGFALHWHRVTAAGCARGGLMLDVGSNFGYYALWAAVMGCRVIAWEPVPTFRAFLALGAQLNNVSHRIHVRASVASDASAPSVSVGVPEHGIAGTASLVTAWAANGTNVDKSIGGGSSSIVHAPAETLDTALRLHEGGAAEQAAILRERPCAMKVDVEGHEPSVLRGATRLLSHLPPRALLFEYSPGVVERARKWSLRPPYAHMLETLRTAGYRMWHLGPLTASDAALPSPPAHRTRLRMGRATAATIARNWRARRGRGTAERRQHDGRCTGQELQRSMGSAPALAACRIWAQYGCVGRPPWRERRAVYGTAERGRGRDSAGIADRIRGGHVLRRDACRLDARGHGQALLSARSRREHRRRRRIS